MVSGQDTPDWQGAVVQSLSMQMATLQYSNGASDTLIAGVPGKQIALLELNITVAIVPTANLTYQLKTTGGTLLMYINSQRPPGGAVNFSGVFVPVGEGVVMVNPAYPSGSGVLSISLKYLQY